LFRSDLFAEDQTEDEICPLPYILILIDELADLMMLEGKNVEESVIRLAQMARAVGMHLVLATQRPSVDVITGIIKANFPARISFRVATRVDSRTILDVMGSEHLLGKGDMLFLPPGSSRLTRVHGAFVTESEIQGVVDFWKAQAPPEYDQSFLIAPPDEGDAAPEGEPSTEDQDPQYEAANHREGTAPSEPRRSGSGGSAHRLALPVRQRSPEPFKRAEPVLTQPPHAERELRPIDQDAEHGGGHQIQATEKAEPVEDGR